MTSIHSTPDKRNSKAPSKRKNTFQRYIQTPKAYVLLLLIILSFVSAWLTPSTLGLRNEAAGVITALVIDTIMALVQNRKKWFADGGIVTALICSMVLSSQADLIAVIVTTVIAVASKHILKIKRKPLFNPAAVGLLVATYLFTSGQSWWGGLSLLPAFSIVVLLICGYLITSRVNKFPQVFSFLFVYFVAFLVLGLLHIGSPGNPLRTPFVNSALFMAFFMLTDPPTSPGTYGKQVIFGALTSAISVLIYMAFGGLSYLLIGLLCGNAFNALMSKMTASSSAQKKRVNHNKPSREQHLSTH